MLAVVDGVAVALHAHGIKHVMIPGLCLGCKSQQLWSSVWELQPGWLNTFLFTYFACGKSLPKSLAFPIAQIVPLLLHREINLWFGGMAGNRGGLQQREQS
jgi:hypothetical protein